MRGVLPGLLVPAGLLTSKLHKTCTRCNNMHEHCRRQSPVELLWGVGGAAVSPLRLRRAGARLTWCRLDGGRLPQERCRFLAEGLAGSLL